LTANMRLSAVREIRKTQRTFAKAVKFALHVAPRHAT
jgi:hypothetical protein